jgi:hypothetical protein
VLLNALSRYFACNAHDTRRPRCLPPASVLPSSRQRPVLIRWGGVEPPSREPRSRDLTASPTHLRTGERPSQPHAGYCAALHRPVGTRRHIGTRTLSYLLIPHGHPPFDCCSPLSASRLSLCPTFQNSPLASRFEGSSLLAIHSEGLQRLPVLLRDLVLRRASPSPSSQRVACRA